VLHLPCSWIYIGQAVKILTECKLHNIYSVPKVAKFGSVLQTQT